jgi:hypothetical protein
LSINTYVVNSAGDSFDMDNYNKLVELMSGKYSYLFM